jgi:hypothetical protein
VWCGALKTIGGLKKGFNSLIHLVTWEIWFPGPCFMNVRCGVQLVQRHPQMLLLPESIYFLSWVLVVLFSFLYGAILVSLRQLRAYGLYPNTLYFFFNEVIHSSPACLRKKKESKGATYFF